MKIDYSKNIWKERNRGHGFVYLLVAYISVKKNIENCNSVGAGAQKVGKVVNFMHNFDLFSRYLESVRGKLYILKKVGHSTFKKIVQNYVYNSTFIF